MWLVSEREEVGISELEMDWLCIPSLLMLLIGRSAVTVVCLDFVCPGRKGRRGDFFSEFKSSCKVGVSMVDFDVLILFWPPFTEHAINGVPEAVRIHVVRMDTSQ